MLGQHNYIKLLGFFLLICFAYSNSTSYFPGAGLVEEEERFEESIDSETERFIVNHKGDDGLNYVPDSSQPAFYQESQKTTLMLSNSHVKTFSKLSDCKAVLPDYYILYHALKLDC